MKIVAFLQNPWFPPRTPRHIITRYRDDQIFHRRILSMSMTGKRLVEAFGEDLYCQIHWDNTNWRAADRSTGKMVPDHLHIETVLVCEKPVLILCFGNQAREAIKSRPWSADILHCHHPNARGRTQEDLNRFATTVRKWIIDHESR